MQRTTQKLRTSYGTRIKPSQTWKLLPIKEISVAKTPKNFLISISSPSYKNEKEYTGDY